MASFMLRATSIYEKFDGFAKYFKNPPNLNSNSLQTWVVVAHYKWTVGLLTIVFTGVVSSWFSDSPMECISKSLHPTSEIPLTESDLCLSYSYTYTSVRDNIPVREKIYVLHYRWIHWVLLALLPLYTLPLLCRKYLEDSKIFTYLNELSTLKNGIKARALPMLVDNYVMFSSWVYKNVLILHFVTLMVDITAFIFIDISLQNKFARLFPVDYPFTRFIEHFNDTISLAFPPYVECRIGPQMKVLNDMEKYFGCQLPLMVWYDKIFIIMWVWMGFLTSWTILTIGYFSLLSVSQCMRRSLIHMSECKAEVKCCLKHLPIGSLLTIQCFKRILSSSDYIIVLQRVTQQIWSLKSEKRQKLMEFNEYLK